jgi:hypothetical protein
MRITKISLFIWACGYRRRHLDYLLGVLARQARDTVVELAYGEAQKVAAAVRDVRLSDRA